MAERKIKWNINGYPSVFHAMERLIAEDFRGDKGRACSAALLAFLMMDEVVRQEYVDALILAEGRGYDGTMLQAAAKVLGRPVNLTAAPTTISETEQSSRAIEQAILGPESTEPKPLPPASRPAGRPASPPATQPKDPARPQTKKG